MNRRDSLKKLILTSGALASLPAWAREWHVNDLNTASSFSPLEQDLLASVADTIIPAGHGIGALSVGVGKFLQKLFDQCYDQAVQENIRVKLAGLETAARTVQGKSFAECDQQQRQDLLLKLSDSGDKSDKDFFDLVKSETIRGFNTSREVMVNHLHYKPVPGHYYGCVDIKA